MTRHSTHRRRFAAVAALGVGLLIALVTLELALRGLASTNTRVGRLINDWDPIVDTIEAAGDSYGPRPLAQIHFPTGAVSHINRQGFRGPEVTVPKPRGELRIALLGGSTTHGWGVGDEETIDAHLRRVLAARDPNRAITIVNLGFDAYDSHCDLERLRRDGLALEPDIVVVHDGINDAWNARFGPDQTEGAHVFADTLARLRARQQRGGASTWELAKHYVYSARLPGGLRSLLSTRARAPMDGPSVPPPGGTDRFARNLLAMADLLPADTPIVYSTPPSSLRQPDASLPYGRGHLILDAATTQHYRDALAERMRAVADDLSRRGRRASYVAIDLPAHLFLDDAHLTSDGNRQVAMALAEALVSSGAFRSR